MAPRHPEPGCWTYEDVVALPDDGNRHEIIAGDHYVMTSPTSDHALAIMRLIRLLLPHADAAQMEWFTGPVGVFFGDANPVQPDLFGFSKGGDWRTSCRGFEGCPVFVIEVLSTFTRGKDLLTKRALYQQSGVKEYWLVDPANGSVEVLALEDGAYRELVRAEGDAPVRSRLFPGLAFPASAIFPM